MMNVIDNLCNMRRLRTQKQNISLQPEAIHTAQPALVLAGACIHRHARIHVYIYTYIHAYIQTFVHLYNTYLYIHAYIYICTFMKRTSTYVCAMCAEIMVLTHVGGIMILE